MWTENRSIPLTRGQSTFSSGTLLVAALGVLQLAGCARANVPSESEARQFVQETLRLELDGIRWKELAGSQPQDGFYPRFSWRPELEPGWDELQVARGFTITDARASSSCAWDELGPGDQVSGKTAPCVVVTARIDVLYAFTRDAYEKGSADHRKYIVIRRGERLVLPERLGPPFLGVAAAREVLESRPYAGASGLDELRRLLTAESPGSQSGTEEEAR